MRAKTDLDALYAIYLTSPEEHINDLLEAVRVKAYRIVGDEDVAQDITISVWGILPSTTIRDSFTKWLNMRIRKYRSRHYKRKANNKELQFLELRDTNGEVMSNSEAAAIIAYWNSPADPSYIGLSDISDQKLRVITYLSLEGWTQAEIAERIGMPHDALRKYLSRKCHKLPF